MNRRFTVLRLFACLIVLLGIAIGVVAALAWYSPITPIDRMPADRFDARLIRQGADLAALGDCDTCHTAPNGRSFVGGLPVPTPFGTIYSTNITPDPETGIGRWSEAAFRRALRQGVDREGRQLYPAFPYDHFTRLTDDDVTALYAYLMTRTPVRASAPPNALPFPLNHRFVVAGWKLLFFNPGTYRPDPAHDAAWNRGAYLVEGIGHCGACHTPRNALGAEKSSRFFAGGEAEGWTAFPINAAAASPVPWNADSLYAYLRQGWHGLHGVAEGPMAPVSADLAGASDGDVRSIAAYVASIIGETAPADRPEGRTLAAMTRPFGTGAKPQSAGSQAAAAPAVVGDGAGATIYAGACAGCHESGRPVPYGGTDLSLSTALNGSTPRNLINILFEGIPAADGARAPIMPDFGAVLTDTQLADLARFLRAKFTDKLAWTEIDAAVRQARSRRATAEASTSAAAGNP
ncbi:MAG TPA: cytochrome c [Aliidongia sp.]|nr:cytochrome c [Aliidongia sp.]